MAVTELRTIICKISPVLHRRAKALTKGGYGRITDLVRKGLENEIISLEQRRDLFEKRDREDPPPGKRGPKRANTLATFHERTPPTVEAPPPIDRLGPIFTSYAERILRAWQNPDEVARHKWEAFAAIKRAAPLTYGDEHKITERLETLIAEKAAALPPTTVEDYHQPLMARPTAAPPAPSQTAVDAREVLSSLANLMRPADDPMAGRTFNVSSIKRKAIVQEEE